MTKDTHTRYDYTALEATILKHAATDHEIEAAHRTHMSGGHSVGMTKAEAYELLEATLEYPNSKEVQP